jgi:hypothetical protein
MEYGTFFLCYLILRYNDRGQDSEISGPLENLKNGSECQKVNVFLIINHYAAVSTLMHVHGCS